MPITSLQFFCLFLLSIGIYYVIPKKFQWHALLAFSIYFFCTSSALYTGIYLCASILVAALCAGFIGKGQAQHDDKAAKRALAAGIAVNAGMLGVLKYSSFFAANVNILTSMIHKPVNISAFGLAAPIGISYYTMQAVGYLLDVYWGISKPQGNVLKTALFIGYYPQLTSGPIARYREVSEQLYCGHDFDWKRVTFGLQRMLWGIFKKLVVSARLGILVDAVYGDTLTYDGFYIWFAAAVFVMQLYTDFSGCMDIILGVSECYGIMLPENFNNPFAARSVQEFWQRWHITLGAWMKDYILYPVLRTETMQGLAGRAKEHFGKKASKRLPSYLGMLCVWTAVGFWHGGGWKYIIGNGFWFWLCIVSGQILEPVFQKIIAALKINTEAFSWRLFQSLRVFCLVSIGDMFFRLKSLREAVHTMRVGFSHWNPEIFFDDSLYALGLSQKEFRLVIVCLFFVLAVSVLQEKEHVREWLSKQNLAFRWAALFALIFGIILFGMYGPGYDAQAFIYEAF